MAPYFTPQRGDIPAKRWRIHPRAKPVAFCCRGKGIIKIAIEDGDPATRLLVEKILEETEEHADKFKRMLE